ncbi:DUF917 family protein [Enterococcus saccharolyticus]|uniref:OsrF n=1 Tax=Candidatus Enterococcus willemsii TaxID=1857215 RepID=A0ABQ6YZ11_9ENTE|nr:MULTISPECIES: DUF917 family protein [Enterococcus]KAF1303615.1 hypothetical protein BAU17_06410 [Enterococcus sp. CU12B]MCD5001667.1 DUF917 family protein [Enterococcus saccharolyticus]
MYIDETKIEALALGGIILGGGGGGSMDYGIENAKISLANGRQPQVIPVDELPENATVLTISAVGAPSATDQYVVEQNFVEIIELLEKNYDLTIDALITNEMGGGSSFNAFIPSALKQIPMVDASCNGRAHPLGTMGAMGLSEKKGYITQQSAVGGNPLKNKEVQLVTQGSVNATSTLIRQAAVEAGGLVVVARNPVNKEFIQKNAALGTLTQSYEVGSAFLQGVTPREKVMNVADYLGGTMVCQGIVEEFELTMNGGLDEGKFIVRQKDDEYVLYIWNEYMALDKNGERQSTFPDLLMSFDQETGLPITTAELKEGQAIFVLQVPYQKLALGAGMFEISGYKRIEQVLGIEIVAYVQELIGNDYYE